MPQKTSVPSANTDNTGEENRPETLKDQHYLKFIQLDYIDGDERLVTILALDATALYNLAVDPVKPDINGAALYADLTERGAVLNDHGSTPAARDYDIQSGRLIYIDHYKNDMQHKPENGGPSYMKFDKHTGVITHAKDYENGRLLREYTQQELIELNRAKGISPDLPPAFKPLELD